MTGTNKPTKLHISTSNKIVGCEAEEKSCPRKHFDSKTDAKIYILEQEVTFVKCCLQFC